MKVSDYGRITTGQGIYAIVHLASGKAYIGGTKSIARRIRDHYFSLVRGTHSNRALQTDWDIHGDNAFAVNILEYDPSTDLKEAERQAIEQHNSYVAGYNGNPQGDGKARLSKIDRAIATSITIFPEDLEYLLSINRNISKAIRSIIAAERELTALERNATVEPVSIAAEVEARTGYSVDEDGNLVGAPCCCYGDNHFSHPYCEQPSDALLQAERDGLIARSLDTGWRWIIV